MSYFGCLRVLESGSFPKAGYLHVREFSTTRLCALKDTAKYSARIRFNSLSDATANVIGSWVIDDLDLNLEGPIRCDYCEMVRAVAEANKLAPLKHFADVEAMFDLIGEAVAWEERKHRILHPS